MPEKHPSSDISRSARQPAGSDPRSLRALTRYDLVLAAIGLLMLCAVVVGHVSTLPLYAAVAAGALLAVPVLLDGLAINPPA